MTGVQLETLIVMNDVLVIVFRTLREWRGICPSYGVYQGCGWGPPEGPRPQGPHQPRPMDTVYRHPPASSAILQSTKLPSPHNSLAQQLLNAVCTLQPLFPIV